jgi:hypothetical protein
MGNPFLFADRFSGAVVHLTTDNGLPYAAAFTANTATSTAGFPDEACLTASFYPAYK